MQKNKKTLHILVNEKKWLRYNNWQNRKYSVERMNIICIFYHWPAGQKYHTQPTHPNVHTKCSICIWYVWRINRSRISDAFQEPRKSRPECHWQNKYFSRQKIAIWRQFHLSNDAIVIVTKMLRLQNCWFFVLVAIQLIGQVKLG